jgi:O-antigen/teichoic acid export membrane protein
MSELKKSTQKAIAWSAVDTTGQILLTLGATLIILWFLSTEDLGMMGSLVLYAGIATVLAEGGLSAALIRKIDSTERDSNTVFWFNFGMGVFFYVVLWLAAPLIAAGNETPGLTPVARVLFLSVVCNSLGVTQFAHLVKQSDFKRIAMANVISVAASSAAVIGMALGGLGVWALVGRAVALSAARTVALWMLSDWRPRMIWDRASFRSLFGFSSKLFLGDLARIFSSYYYTSALRASGFFTLAQTGLYYNANKVKETGTGFLTHIFGQSLYVMLSQLQNDAARFLQALRKSIRTLAFLLFPLMLGLGVTARALLGLFPDGKWLPAVPLLQLFCFSGLFVVLNYVYGNALKVKGRSDLTLIFDIIQAGLLIGLFFGVISRGLEQVVWADVAARGVLFLGYAVAHWKVSGYQPGQQLRDLAPYAALATAMCALIWPLKFMIDGNLLLLAAQTLLGIGFYIGVNRLLGSKVLNDAVNIFRKRH